MCISWKHWLSTVATLALASSCSQPDGSGIADATPGNYLPTNDVANTWGAFDFYGPHATFASFKGHLALEPVGQISKSAAEQLNGAHVYRIVNASELHEQNAGNQIRCLAPALWLALKPSKNELSVALLTLADWRDFEPKKPGLCGMGTYGKE